MIAHELGGCAPTPLAHYLKALGVLRLISEQADPQARGWWEGGRFFLGSYLDANDIETFFLESYRPTPLVAPWNNGSGFYPKDKKARKAHDTVLGSTSPRFSEYQAIIVHARTLVGNRKEAPDDDEKRRFIQSCRQAWRGNALSMLETALVIDGENGVRFPSLTGTGWNDAKFDFSSNFLIRLLRVVAPNGNATKDAASLLRDALWGTHTHGLLTGDDGKVGQFLPGGAGGANSVNGPGHQNDTLLNPWDFVLMLEGAVLFTAHASRRMGARATSRAAAPFAVSAHGAGYASASDKDESARGEQWMPLWSQPLTLPELRRLLAEGRAQIGSSSAQEPLDLARAVARLGTARGIVAFQRYGYFERNGQSNLAVPLSRVVVPEQTVPRLATLDDLQAWLPRLRLQARDTKNRKASASLKQAEKRLADTLFAVVQHPDEALRWQSVLESLAGVEAVMRHGAGLRAGPIPKLRPEWVWAADDGSPEFRLALAFALQAAGYGKEGEAHSSVRRHWWLMKPTDANAVVMQGRCGETDAIAMVARRLIEAAQRGQRRLPLQAARRAAADAGDLSLLTAGQANLDRVLTLARALMALDTRAWFASGVRPVSAPRGAMPDDAWLALRLAMLPWPLRDGRRIGVDPAIFRRLVAGDAAGALELALRRLRAAGIATSLRVGATDPATARRWAAALAFPITQTTASKFLDRIELKPQENRHER
jgi:CRISPR-associated protein Csx17